MKKLQRKKGKGAAAQKQYIVWKGATYLILYSGFCQSSSVLCRVADLMNTNFNFLKVNLLQLQRTENFHLLWFCILLMLRFTVYWQFVFSSFGILLMFGFTDYCQKVKLVAASRSSFYSVNLVGLTYFNLPMKAQLKPILQKC